MKVLIAGAGIGGLTLALMLHQRGIKTQLFERAAKVQEVGVGINTLPHAIKELAALDLLAPLDAIAMRTRELRYLTRQGQEVWRDLRGLHDGHDAPQFSIHRGKFQKVLYDAVLKRLGPNSVKTGSRFTGFVQDESGVAAHFVDNIDGASSRTERGDILICADGIHSAGRKIFYPNEGPPSWNGVVMWRGAVDWPIWEDGETMAIGGGMGGKFVLYPITPAKNGKQLMNWVVATRIADGAVSPPPADSWSKKAPLSKVLPHAKRFTIPGMDIEALVRATNSIFEYPMADRDGLPRWTHGRVTLLGDAAHPMYPVGSNGASQAILDARCLADALANAEHPRQALYEYDNKRRPITSQIVKLNRAGGPERIIDEIEKLSPTLFDDIDQVLSHKKREAIVKGYAGIAGFSSKEKKT
ncbi:MAG: flavin-dependent oxidoreductase [Paracoccaceae bacterium]